VRTCVQQCDGGASQIEDGAISVVSDNSRAHWAYEREMREQGRQGRMTE